MTSVTINSDRRIYVLKERGGITCLGFDVAFKRLAQYAAKLCLPAPCAEDIGTEKLYKEYLKAESLYVARKPDETLFDPETPVAVQNILEQYRKSGDKLRVMLGDSKTGRDWLEEHDCVGTVGRSMGPIKIALLVPRGDDGGCALLTACIVKLVDGKTKRVLYRHPNYHQAELKVVASDKSGYAEMVTSDGKPLARFAKVGQAAKWVEFMQGTRMSPR